MWIENNNGPSNKPEGRQRSQQPSCVRRGQRPSWLMWNLLHFINIWDIATEVVQMWFNRNDTSAFHHECLNLTYYLFLTWPVLTVVQSSTRTDNMRKKDKYLRYWCNGGNVFFSQHLIEYRIHPHFSFIMWWLLCLWSYYGRDMVEWCGTNKQPIRSSVLPSQMSC